MADSITTTMTGSSGDSITVDVSTSLVSAVESASSLDLQGDVNVQGLLTDSGVAVTNQNDLDAHTGDTTNPHSVTASQVSAPTQTEFDNHAGDTSNPDNVTALQAGAISGSVVADSTVQLSGGSAVVATGVSTSVAELNIDIGVDGSSVAGDCKVGAVAFWDESAGNHKVEIYEYDTNIGNPTVSYRIWQA